MAKKDFTTADTGRVYTAITEATADPDKRRPRKTYTPEEAAELMENMNTVGRKGVKMPRINMAFRPEEYEYICIMSRVMGKSMSEFINDVIRYHKETHMDLYQQVLDIRASL